MTRGKITGAQAGVCTTNEISAFAKRRMTREERLLSMLLEPAKAARFESQPNMARWFCVSVAGGTDFTIAGKLSTAGVDVFVLREKWVAVKAGKKIEGERPVFGGYIFVRMMPVAEAFHAVKQVKDVLDILGDGVRYTEVPAAHLDVFTKVCEKADVERMPVDRTIGQGSRAVITEDLFKGYECVVVQVFSGRHPDVRVSISGFGEYAHDVTMPLAFLRKL